MRRCSGSPQFWEVAQLDPRLGSPNTCAIWDPITTVAYIETDDSDSEGSSSGRVALPPARPGISLTVSPRRTSAPPSPRFSITLTQDHDSGFASLGDNLTLDSLSSYIQDFSYSPRRFGISRQIEIAQSHASSLGSFAADFLQAFQSMDSKAEELKIEARQMRLSLLHLSRTFKRMEAKTCRALWRTRSFHVQLRDVRYLDQLLFILNGEIDKMSLQNWPFAVAHGSRLAQGGEVNLIV